MRRLHALGLVLLLASAVLADDAAEKSDPRLDQKVSLDVVHAKLEDVAKSLADQTGVTIEVGSNERDWQVREQRVTIQAKDMRLETVLEQVSGLLSFRLTRNGEEDKWTYQLWQDAKSRALEQEMRTAVKEASAQRALKTRQDTMDMAQNALAMTPEQAAKKRKDDPLTAYLGSTKSGRGFASLLSYINKALPIERDLMLRGKRVSIPVSSLPPALRQAVADANSGGLAAALREEMPGLGNLVPHEIVIMPVAESGDEELQMMGAGALMEIRGMAPGGDQDGGQRGGEMSILPLCSSGSKMGRLVAEALFSLDEGQKLEQVSGQLDETMQDPSFQLESIARESKTEKSPPTDPELTREVEFGQVSSARRGFGALEVTAEQVAAWMEELSKSLDRPVMLESFNRLPSLDLFVQPGKQPVYKILIGLEKAGYAWQHEERVFRIRPQDWAPLRSYRISEAFIAGYEKLLERQGSFTLDDVASVAAALTDDQMDHFRDIESDLTFALPVPSGRERTFVKLYGSFSPRQKEALVSEAGLPFARLSDRQWQLAGEMMVDQLGGVYVRDGSVSMRVGAVGNPDEAGEEKPQSDGSVGPQPTPPRSEEEAAWRDVTTYAYCLTVMVAGEETAREIKGTIRVPGPKNVQLMKKRRLEREKKQAEEKAKTKDAKPADKPAPSP